MKKLAFNTFYFLLFVLIVYSCKKDDDTVTDFVPGVSGSWKYLSGVTTEKYLQIYPNRTYSVLSSTKQGIRGRNDGILLVTANQIIISRDLEGYPTSDVYNYNKNGDSLFLTKPSGKITLVRDKLAPDTSDWIKSIVAVTKIKAPISSLSDIGCDGTNIWYGNAYETSYLYKINLTTLAKDSIPVTQYAWSVEADGANLWVSSDGSSTITKISKTTGSFISTSIAMGAWIYGIALDNNFIWCYSNNENTLYKYNPSSNSISSSVKVDGYWQGLAMANSYLYVASSGKIAKCTTSPLMGTASFELPGYYIYGIAFDGTNFWVTAYKSNDDSSKPEIIKVSGID